MEDRGDEEFLLVTRAMASMLSSEIEWGSLRDRDGRGGPITPLQSEHLFIVLLTGVLTATR